MSNELLRLEKVSKTFGGLRAVQRVDLAVQDGTIAALIGPNGAGKTTLLNIMTGVYGPSEGSVHFASQKIDGLPTHQIVERGLVRTFQLTRLFKGMTVVENVMVGAHSWARAGRFFPTILNQSSVVRQEREVHEYALKMLTLVNLEKLAHEPAGNLPHGQQRLLELARAMAAKPRLLLLDEPAAGLNHHEEDRLKEGLQSILKAGTTILLVEHHMRLVMSISDWVHVIDLGRKIAEGPPREIGKNPAVIKAYLGKEH
jgi:ABC-type branched-subunit amino acid transport system ATPase component